jgi:hypothetical protein
VERRVHRLLIRPAIIQFMEEKYRKEKPFAIEKVCILATVLKASSRLTLFVAPWSGGENERLMRSRSLVNLLITVVCWTKSELSDWLSSELWGLRRHLQQWALE